VIQNFIRYRNQINSVALHGALPWNPTRSARFYDWPQKQLLTRDRMQTTRRLASLALATAVTGGAAISTQARAEISDLGSGAGFQSGTAAVNGTTLHYVRGGHGPAIILLHGFPQDWLEYKSIMPALSDRFTVVAVDLRGIGGSRATEGGYDSANLAADIKQLADALKLDRPYIVGHDLGGQVAFAFIQHYPQAARGAMILDSPLPGIAGWDESLNGPAVWHVGFMQVPNLAEQLVQGRQAAFLGYFFQFAKFTPAEQEHYLAAYNTPGQLKAAFGMYRAFPENVKAATAKRGPNPTPVVYATGEKSPFASLAPKVVADLKGQGFAQVEAAAIPGAVHYVVEDAPDAVAELIEKHAGATPPD
jgi:pimeloyl-ACP methyl ester carboxylesterase